MNSTSPLEDRTHTVDILNSLLRGELSAVETYEQVLTKFTSESLPTVTENCEEHRERVELIRTRIRQLGGTPTATSGAWGVFANAMEAGAKLLGKDAAINVLESGEDRGLKDYRKDFSDLDFESLNLITTELLPGQERSHQRMSQLKHRQETN